MRKSKCKLRDEGHINTSSFLGQLLGCDSGFGCFDPALQQYQTRLQRLVMVRIGKAVPLWQTACGIIYVILMKPF